MIKTMVLTLAAGLAFSLGSAAVAAPASQPKPTPAPPASASEAAFVSDASAYLGSTYPTPADAVKAGFFRYGDEDDTGAISYVNLQWTSTDAHHPSQLWYDVKGRLLGADYSVPLTDDRPTLWGIAPSRWGTFHAHIHYGITQADGSVKYGGLGAKKFTAAGGNATDPTAAQLVAAGAAPNAAAVKFVFDFPAIWDLEVWLIPNPDGAFAEYNPTVKPSKSGSGMSM